MENFEALLEPVRPAVERYVPECRPDFAKCSRIEIYDTEENIFR